ncbi:MAG: ABC transporter permease [Prevotellaceae bacterium]|nr:ABC transporter permease [Prevotellaceae bacterium]
MNIKIFDSDLWHEVVVTVSQQKMRSLMTMFGVFWGIFMLILLVGCGFGFGNGIIGQLTSLDSNTFFLFPENTTMPYQGYDRDRTWKFKNSDIGLLKAKLADRLDNIMQVNADNDIEVKHDITSSSYSVLGITPNYIKVVPQRIVAGRYINQIDVEQHRKVCLLGTNVAKVLFADDTPLGQHVSVAGVMHTVVGVIKRTNDNIQLGGDPTESVVLPITTEQDVMNRHNEFDFMSLTNLPQYPIEDDEERIVSAMKEEHHIAPDDENAVYVFSLKSALAGFLGIQLGINILIWIIGIGTLAAGLIGIANIMIVTIKERTQEIGVRRALGAQPSKIIQQIMMESLTLTLTAGIAGIVAGVWCLYGLDSLMSGSDGSSMTLIKHPMISIVPTLAALVILIAGGLLAGYFPTQRALKVKAIEALREE